VFVRTTTGTITINLTSDASTDDLFQEVSRVTGIPVEDIRLIYAGKQLKSSRSLADYGVGNEATLDLSERLLGGCYWCHRLGHNKTAPPHRSQNCNDPANAWGHAHGGGGVLQAFGLQPNPAHAGRPPCKYGSACYRTNPNHLAKYSHPGDGGGGGHAGGPNGVMLLTSRRGHRVFMATSGTQFTTFGGRWDPRDNDSWDTAWREYLEEGGNLLPNRASCQEFVVTHRNGSTTSYWVGPAPAGTQWVVRPGNTETDGGVWMTRRQLEAAHAAGNLRFGKRVLEVVRRIGL